MEKREILQVEHDEKVRDYLEKKVKEGVIPSYYLD